MIDGISQMVCVYVIFRIFERLYHVWNDPDSKLKLIFSLVAVIAIIMVVSLALGVHQTALTVGQTNYYPGMQ